VSAPPTLVYDDDRFLAHETGPLHVENPGRLAAIRKALAAAALPTTRAPSPPVDPTLPLLVHTEHHVERVRAGCEASKRLDPDTQTSPASWEAALLAASCAADAARKVLSGEASNAFVVARPPGHHATPNRAMGFCLFNNAGVAAEAALRAGARRVAIFDPDVHHGNGTQDIFYDREDVLYVSIHESPLYPGTGHVTEQGSGRGAGFTVNLPVSAATGEKGFERLLSEVALPVLREFRPDLLVVSAGYDAHHRDPLGHLLLGSAFYHSMFRALLEAEPRVVAVLEGGYDYEGISRGVTSSVAALAGVPCPEWAESVPPGNDTDPLLPQFRREHGEYWSL
jgi:acetoin utilization deacetylase AcuC-like enzyme